MSGARYSLAAILKQRVLGLDIGAHSVKAAELVHTPFRGLERPFWTWPTRADPGRVTRRPRRASGPGLAKWPNSASRSHLRALFPLPARFEGL